MKNLIFAILFLSALTAYFSFYGENVPSVRTAREGWGFFGGTSGEIVPGDGENGEIDVFRINAPQETTPQQIEAQESPISVTVVEQTVEKEQTRGMFFIGVALGALLAELATASVIAILFWLDSRKRRNLYEKCKNRP